MFLFWKWRVCCISYEDQCIFGLSFQETREYFYILFLLLVAEFMTTGVPKYYDLGRGDTWWQWPLYLQTEEASYSESSLYSPPKFTQVQLPWALKPAFRSPEQSFVQKICKGSKGARLAHCSHKWRPVYIVVKVCGWEGALLIVNLLCSIPGLCSSNLFPDKSSTKLLHWEKFLTNTLQVWYILSIQKSFILKHLPDNFRTLCLYYLRWCSCQTQWLAELIKTNHLLKREWNLLFLLSQSAWNWVPDRVFLVTQNKPPPGDPMCN